MTPQSPSLGNQEVVSPSLGAYDKPVQPEKQVGAFAIPNGTTVAGTSVKPTTDHVSLNLGDGSTKVAGKAVEIPKVEWRKPVTAVQAAAGSEGGEKMVITYVGDGDSASGKRSDGSAINCRIDSIDAPEVAHRKAGKSGQAFGEESKRTLEQMILNKEVTVRVSKPATGDKNYGRALCQIEIEGQNVDKEMLRTGMSWLYRRYNSDAGLAKLENEARGARRGLWVDPVPVNPESFRRMENYGR